MSQSDMHKTNWVSPRTRTRTTQRHTFLENSMRSSLPESRVSMCEIQSCDGSCTDSGAPRAGHALAPESGRCGRLQKMRAALKKQSTTSVTNCKHFCAKHAVGLVLQVCLEERAMEKLALPCYFALDVYEAGDRLLNGRPAPTEGDLCSSLNECRAGACVLLLTHEGISWRP